MIFIAGWCFYFSVPLISPVCWALQKDVIYTQQSLSNSVLRAWVTQLSSTGQMRTDVHSFVPQLHVYRWIWSKIIVANHCSSCCASQRSIRNHNIGLAISCQQDLQRRSLFFPLCPQLFDSVGQKSVCIISHEWIGLCSGNCQTIIPSWFVLSKTAAVFGVWRLRKTCVVLTHTHTLTWQLGLICVIISAAKKML